MGKDTEISWTDSPWHPWWGCTKIDPACANCYAAAFDARLGRKDWGPLAPRRFFGDEHWAEPVKWNRAAQKKGEKQRVFCASMADWAGDRRDLDPWRVRMWKLVRETEYLDWLMLTKRADKIEQFLPPDWGQGYPNVWLGVTVGDNAGLWRAEQLRQIPAVVRFLSVEPLLERIQDPDLSGIHWVIVGGESGPKCRPMNLAWPRFLLDDCLRAGTAYFFKQEGGHPNKRDRMGNFPPDLQVREFPRGRQLGQLGLLSPSNTSAL